MRRLIPREGSSNERGEYEVTGIRSDRNFEPYTDSKALHDSVCAQYDLLVFSYHKAADLRKRPICCLVFDPALHCCLPSAP